MTHRRGNSRSWEIRLGALQVVVWLGLAIGGIFGSYFIGFFSGRSVGFETARSASGVDVPKLALSEELPERSSHSMASVMGKLNNVATLTEESKPAGSPKVESPELKAVKAGEAKSLEATKPVESLNPKTTTTMFDQDAIFNEQLTDDTNDTTPILGSPEREISGKGGEVRVLGGNSVAATPPAAKEGDKDVIAPSRVVSADSSKKGPPIVEQKVAVKDQKKEKVSVVKKLSKGHFAQVGSPKNLAEAEALARSLRRSGFPAIIEETSKGRSPFYRVMVGPEDNKVQAGRLVEQIKREPYIKGTVFVRSNT